MVESPLKLMLDGSVDASFLIWTMHSFTFWKLFLYGIHCLFFWSPIKKGSFQQLTLICCDNGWQSEAISRDSLEAWLGKTLLHSIEQYKEPRYASVLVIPLVEKLETSILRNIIKLHPYLNSRCQKATILWAII
jgi:hypothetical protein